MPDTQIAKIVDAREYIPCREVRVDGGEVGTETVLVPVDKNAAISQNHISVAVAQKVLDSLAVKLANKRDLTPKEALDYATAQAKVVEMRAIAYSSDRPAALPLLDSSTAKAIGEGMGNALVDTIQNGGDLKEKLLRAQQKAEAKVVEVDPAK